MSFYGIRLKRRYKHHTNGVYIPIMFTNVETSNQEKYPTTVVYLNEVNGKHYSRAVDDWHRSFTILE